jgi:hypothetical protein
MDPKEAGYEDVDRVHPAQNTVQWRAFVITVMNLGLP